MSSVATLMTSYFMLWVEVAQCCNLIGSLRSSICSDQTMVILPVHLKKELKQLKEHLGWGVGVGKRERERRRGGGRERRIINC